MSISAISSLGSATTSLAIHPSSALTHERNGSTTYSFNPASQTNIAVYWGASPATTSDSLLALCQHPNVDIVILAFLGTYFGPGGYPSLKIGGSSCRAATPEQQAIAPGLVDCTAIAPSIAECQQASKPVLLSLGGSSITSSFESDEQAKEFSSTLWALFGADTANETTRSIRPFGPNIVLDGFDLDAESDMPQHYLAFTQALRAKYSKDPGKAYYISGSPHCPIPDTSLPLEAMLLLDWVWPRFYNAKKCNANSKGFLNSVSDWSVQLKTNGTTRPRLYPGVAVSNLTGSGSVRATDLHKHVNGIDISKMGNFGGLMLWDGSLALFEGTDRMNYLDYARNALVKLQDTVRTD
ncbi:glycoside hydrolase family 18 protein [Zasmidium cellare ATCC 36951]|uniref:chitinase n=1 Tax=Zasmidium cellare ATCC 36951 TaxID=1080233 RepID=A0A6A6CXJ5_ZASCE|nr:glycoside hydrolase family 18 protein [Zasmidium cellare ATCC 36951]KAF2170930.1 glycoside hydrolase family 18 protein [Zasmidium cellare ATCC 36951]